MTNADSLDKILILDFGSQYTQLIARKIREQKVYCEIHPFNYSVDRIKEFSPKGIILSGGPSSVYGKDAPIIGKEVLELGIPPISESTVVPKFKFLRIKLFLKDLIRIRRKLYG